MILRLLNFLSPCSTIYILVYLTFAVFLRTCREMTVVHSDADFLDDIAGKLKEVRNWAM